MIIESIFTTRDKYNYIIAAYICVGNCSETHTVPSGDAVDVLSQSLRHA